MNTPPDTSLPRIETLLAATHQNYAALRESRAALTHVGIGKDDLPADADLMAFALLGDHERDALLAQLCPHWTALQFKGLVYGAVENAATPRLRLLRHALPHAKDIAPFWRQLQDAVDAPEPPYGIWQGPTRVCGAWGVEARLHFSVLDVQHLLIDPDPVFGLQSYECALDPDTSHAVSFPFPVDNGGIAITLRHRNGQVYRLSVESMVEGVAP